MIADHPWNPDSSTPNLDTFFGTRLPEGTLDRVTEIFDRDNLDNRQVATIALVLMFTAICDGAETEASAKTVAEAAGRAIIDLVTQAYGAYRKRAHGQ